ncbi:MAG: hypothetical protein KFB95_03210 [Simkaniaceae bacterium]|nr:MAG: hypothetical protein KFB95_03210 [Simkaniaceae bacterium]
MESNGVRVYGGGMHNPPVIIQDGEVVGQGGCFDALIQIATDFFKWVGSLFGCCSGNSAVDERSPLMEGGASRVTLPKPKINAEISALDREMTARKVFSFNVGSEEEPRRDHSSGEPQIAHKITTISGLRQVEGTEISVQREVKEKVESGFYGYDVIGPDGKPFDFEGEPLNSLKLIAGCAGMEVAEAFDGLTISNPVSVFQIMIQNHFDPKEQSETALELDLAMKHGIAVFNQEERSTLILLPNQGDGVLRFVVEADENFGKIVEGERVRSYRVRQEVTIHPGEGPSTPAHVEVVRTARIK